jgi:hypothetical protein
MPDPLSPVIITTSGAVPSVVSRLGFGVIFDALQFSLESSAIQANKKERDQVIGSLP